MILVLSIILFVLCILIGGTRGLKTYIVLFVDIIFAMLNIFLLGVGFPIIPTTFIICIIVSTIILFNVNGYNKKTIAAFFATLFILVVLFFIVYLFTSVSKIQGFGEESIEEIGWCSYVININMVNITISSIIIGLIGTIVDASVDIATSTFEIYDKNPKITFKELTTSGMKVGQDVLSTMVNTLFFAFLGGFLTLIIWFNIFNYNLPLIINDKVFVAELMSILFNALGCILIIPTTNYIISYILVNKDKKIVKRIEKSIKYNNE